MGRTFAYPVNDPADWAAMRRLSPWRRLVLALRERRYRKRAVPAEGVELRPQESIRPLERDDLALVCTVRNSAPYLPAFLAHYRRLGVTRFVFVDDRSDDGTFALLAGEPDVDLFTSNVTYGEAVYGRVWRDALFSRYGRERWYLNVDADEFLLFPDCETRNLRDLIADLERADLRRCLAPMLDLYPDGPLRDAVFDPALHTHPLEVSPLIDGGDYEIAPEKFCMAVRGGPRTRLFGNRIRLTKFPVIFVDEATQENGSSIHGPLPIARNFSAVNAVLLHYKFSAASVEEFARLAGEGQHFGGGVFYAEIARSGAFHDDLSLRYPGSLRVGSSMDLVRRGFMEDLRARAI
ncbi:glycosyltransferase family 2 protein [Aureimonas sp. ME7]|uniref:glycosyltransferase family 2 protein n=1 Tax=Aureimonas sp. ME7 TaxID=2744252 RepID=UPI001FCEBD57|nr:glycosyltransferase family 2 protein [Aureimonas sp. ME7]